MIPIRNYNERIYRANVVFAGDLVDSGAITSTGRIQGTSITDGTATMTGGNLSSIGTIGCEQSRQLKLSMEQLTVDTVFNGQLQRRIVIQ